MAILESVARGRVAAAGGGRAASTGLLLGGLAALAFVIGWEVAHPSLPVSFELAAAARSPGAPSWAGRLPMAATALLGSVAFYLFIARTASTRAAMYAVAVLATAPAWFVHARTMTGAIVPMACSVMVLAGSGISALDVRATTSTRAGATALAVAAAIGSVIATRFGVPNRGVLAVVGVPLLAVGAAAMLWGARGRAATAALGAGVLIAIVAIVAAVLRAEGTLADLMLGARATEASAAPTFDAPIAALAYGLVPWTPLVPLALARRPTSAGHLAVMIGAALAIAVHAALAPRSGMSTFVGVASVAGAVALMLRSLEDARRPAVALVATAGVVGWLVSRDIGLSPDRVLVAFGATGAALPAAHAAASSMAVRSSLWLCTILTAVALLAPRSWLPAGRGLAIAAAGAVAGLTLRVHAYPELLARLSPGAVFDAWATRHQAGEPLGLVGIDRRTLAFAPDAPVVPQADGPAAGRWLAEADHGAPGETRRFLALATTELPRVNAAYRRAHARNVPVLAGNEGATLLAASALARGERSTNPLDAVVLAAPPQNLRTLGAVLGGQLDALGWQLVDERGRVIEAVPRGSRRAHVRVVVRAGAGAGAGAMSGYCTFLHVDHSPSRFSAEHREHAYPMTLWREGDIVVDDFDVRLPAHFRVGSYKMFWGVGALPCEDDRRMHVTSGPNDGRDRVPAGVLEVR